VQTVRYRVSLLLLAGVVAGCHSGRPDQDSAVRTNASAATTVAMAPEPMPPHPKKKAPSAAVLRPQIDDLIGWNESEIKTVFGTPAVQEDHAPTKQMVYHAKKCTMNVTLYPEVETKQFHVLNYEVNSDDGSAKRQQVCVAEFSSRLPAKPLPLSK